MKKAWSFSGLAKPAACLLYTSPSANVGELKTWGWEIDVRWRDKIGKHFSYWVGANLSDSQNELVKYEGSNVIQEGVVPLLEGYPLNTIWGYRTAGLYQETPDVYKRQVPFRSGAK